MKIVILGFDQGYSGSITGLLDIFHHARKLWLASGKRKGDEDISIYLISTDGKPILCQNNILLNVHGSLEDAQYGDIFIITSIHDYETAVSNNRLLADWLKSRHSNGAALASICTGSFLLAETGLLDHKAATTHWTAVEAFKKRYPKIDLQPDKMLIDHGDLYCSAGSSASMDLAYYLIEKYFGYSIAARTAKFLLHDFRRVSQSVYTIYDAKTDHEDTEIQNAQRWINRNLSEPLNINRLLDIAGMSARTFERRFKNATGEAPATYIQQMRVEIAKQKIETTSLSFDEISYRVGYNNAGSFRKIFVKWVGVLPSVYRQKFKKKQPEQTQSV